MPDPALGGLYGLRDLPLGWAELIAAVALGLLLAGLLALSATLFRKRSGPPPLARQIIAARRLAPDGRAIVLTGLLRDLTNQTAPGPAPWPERAARHFGLDADTATALADLYRPGNGPDPDALERTLLKAVA